MGTDYVAHVMHKNKADKDMGFNNGWDTVAGRLARLVETGVTERAGAQDQATAASTIRWPRSMASVTIVLAAQLSP